MFISPKHTLGTRWIFSLPGLHLSIFILNATDGVFDRFTFRAEIHFKNNPVDSKCNIRYQYTHSFDILAFNDP